MSKSCAITGASTSFGRSVSFSHRVTRRTFKANLHSHRLWVPEINRHVRVTLSSKGLRTVEKHGGLVAALRAQGKTLADIGIK